MDTFKAMVCEKTGKIDNLVLKAIARQELPEGYARIRVLASGVNFPDKLMVEGKYQFSPPLPFIPGMEIAGEIVQVKKNARFQIGSRVISSVRFGGYSQETIAPIHSLISIPENFSPEEAAGFRITSQTALVALIETAAVEKNETVMVIGAAGGVGSAAIKLGKAIGVNVIAVSSSKSKQNFCKRIGADHSLGYDDLKSNIMEITNGKGVDTIFDPVGGENFRNILSCVRWGGKYLVVGFASGSIPVLPINIALIKGISLIGIRAGEYFRKFPEREKQAISKLLKMAKSNLITPVIYKTLPLSDAVEALRLLEDRLAMGRIILKPN